MAAQTTTFPEEALIRSIATSIPAPEGVRLKSITFDFDHMGEPAIRVVFLASEKFGFKMPRIRKLGAFQRAVRDRILEKSGDAFPYVSFEDAKG